MLHSGMTAFNDDNSRVILSLDLSDVVILTEALRAARNYVNDNYVQNSEGVIEEWLQRFERIGAHMRDTTVDIHFTNMGT